MHINEKLRLVRSFGLTVKTMVSTITLRRGTAGLWLCLRTIKRRKGFTCSPAWVAETCGEREGSFCNGPSWQGFLPRPFWRLFYTSSAKLRHNGLATASRASCRKRPLVGRALRARREEFKTEQILAVFQTFGGAQRTARPLRRPTFTLDKDLSSTRSKGLVVAS